MAKRKETIEIENLLHEITREKRIYGCEEVTIGFYGKGHGNEIVDFMTMDSKGIVRCYEIKVTLSDLKSKAKKSWYGHYNYLVVTYVLFQKIKDNLNEYVPNDVGVMVYSGSFSSAKNPKKKDIGMEGEILCKESLVRSMYYKMTKYKDAIDPVKNKELKDEVKKARKDKENYLNRALKAEKLIHDYEWYASRNMGRHCTVICLEEMAEKEKEKFLKRIDEMGKKPDTKKAF